MIVYSGGSFDGLHVGHIDLFNWCRDLAGDGEVIISLNTDDFIRRYKGKLPVFTYEERKEAILSVRGLIDEVIPNEGGEDSKPAILKVNPDIIAIGSDWMRKDYCKQMGFTPDWLEEQRIALIYVPRNIKMSSTMIKERMSDA